jgi:hypothetical protein
MRNVGEAIDADYAVGRIGRQVCPAFSRARLESLGPGPIFRKAIRGKTGDWGMSVTIASPVDPHLVGAGSWRGGSHSNMIALHGLKG